MVYYDLLQFVYCLTSEGLELVYKRRISFPSENECYSYIKEYSSFYSRFEQPRVKYHKLAA